MKKIVFLALLLPMSLLAQVDNQPKTNPWALGLVPQYAFTNGIRVDLDVPLNHTNSLIIAPQIYMHSGGNSWIWDYNEMLGAGVNIKHRKYLMQMKNQSGFYLDYGPTFQTFSITQHALLPEEFTEDGATYIELVDGETTTQLFKFGLDFTLGARLVAGKLLYVDPFIGMGIRMSFDNQTSGLHKHYDSFWYDYGYTGIIIVAGWRFGVLL